MTSTVTAAPPAIRVDGLGRQYRRWPRPATWALRDCAFQLPAGQVAALVGTNGSGKTTLLSVLAGLLTPTEGTAEIDGHTVPACADDGRGRTAFVAHDTPLYRRLTPADTLELGRRTHRRWDQPRAQSWLNRFDIPADRPCGDLSAGQQAQVAMAHAIGTTPSVLLLDEPMSRIDPVGRVEFIRALLAEVTDTGLTVLLSTHAVADLTGLADRLLMLAGGRLTLDADVDDLLDTHVRYTGPRSTTPPTPGDVIHETHTDRQSTYLLRLPPTTPRPSPPTPWRADPPSLDEVVVAHLRSHPGTRT
jgi:ABC-2 type transport system ATP-binding protein